MQVWFQVEPPFAEAKKPSSELQLKSLPPVSRSAALLGLAAIGSSSTGLPPSDAWTLGKAQGVGEQVGSWGSGGIPVPWLAGCSLPGVLAWATSTLPASGP